MSQIRSNSASRQDELYDEAASSYGPALGRLVRGYEADPENRRDLEQEIHVALWRSLPGYDGRCSLRTWVYRVAHNVAATHVIKARRARPPSMVSLEDIDALAVPDGKNDGEQAADRRLTIDRLLALVQQLNPLDRQVILLYLEDSDAASIAEVTGISAGNVATKIHRIKSILVRRFHEGGSHGE